MRPHNIVKEVKDLFNTLLEVLIVSSNFLKATCMLVLVSVLAICGTALSEHHARQPVTVFYVKNQMNQAVCIRRAVRVLSDISRNPTDLLEGVEYVGLEYGQNTVVLACNMSAGIIFVVIVGDDPEQHIHNAITNEFGSPS